MDRIKIDRDRKIAEIPDTLFGSFIEHLGSCVYGGILDETGKARTDDTDVRLDVLEAVKRMKPGIIRWPGGNFVSGYHWMDGIGDRQSRRTLRNIAWGGVENNHFGTDEFLDYCRKTEALPLICTNMGTGTIEEARNWLEYCNGKAGTYYADLRRANGHEEPYGVRYWGIGNEMNGFWQIGQLSGADFGKKAREACKLMKWTDPSVQLILAGDCTDDPGCVDYDRALLDETAPYIDLFAIHMYARNDSGDFREYMAHSERIRHKIDLTKGQLLAAAHKAGRKEPIGISFDEWNVYYREDSTAASECQIGERYNLEDALVVGLFLNALIRNCDTVKVACQALLVNAAASIVTDETDCFLQTIYYPLALTYRLRGEEALDALVVCDTYDTKRYSQVPYLDVAATVSEKKGETVLFVVNKDVNPRCARIQLPDSCVKAEAEVYEVYHDDIKAENSFADKQKVGVTKKKITDASGDFVYTFEKHSYTVLRLFTERK